MTELSIGSDFAGHRIEEVAGRGGMGVLYRARHLELDVIRALKVIVPEHTADDEFRARFKREWRLAARIEHPNVIPVHEVGEEDGVLYISMRFIEGQDLGRLIGNEGPLEPIRVANIIDQVAYALDAAHEAGLVHRDVKPANILIESGPRGEKAYLTDFGLTKAAASNTAMTASGMFVGTIDYMSPEQFEGDSLDARADVYALGCVLYEALTGRVPFARDGYQARIFAHMSAEPPAPSDVVPGLPDGIDEVVQRAMAKKPDERFLSAGDLGRAALAAAAGQRVSRAQRNVARGDAAPKSADPVKPYPQPDDAGEAEPEAGQAEESTPAPSEPSPDETAIGSRPAASQPQAGETALAGSEPAGADETALAGSGPVEAGAGETAFAGPDTPVTPPPKSTGPLQTGGSGAASGRGRLFAGIGVAVLVVVGIVAVLASGVLGGGEGGSETERVESALATAVSEQVSGAPDVEFTCDQASSGGFNCEDDAGADLHVSSQGGNQYSFSGSPGGAYSGASGSFTAD